jgi:hypothetical protein
MPVQHRLQRSPVDADPELVSQHGSDEGGGAPRLAVAHPRVVEDGERLL